MSGYFRLFFVAAFNVFLATGLCAANLATLGGGKDKPVDISADSFTTTSNGWIAADGNVFIRKADIQITADHILVNRATGEIEARDNVCLIREGQGAIRTSFLKYNYKTGEGISSKLDVQAGVLRVIADEIRRRPDGTFDLGNAMVTTCTNAPSELHYAACGATAVYSPGEYVELEDMTLRFNDVPVFYFPWWRRSFADHYGWRFLPGYETDWGAYLLATYKRQLIDFGGEFHDSLDSRTHIDYRTDRGFALGQDFAWHFGNADTGHKGFISAYGLSDDDPMGESLDRIAERDLVEKTRYRFTLRHDSYFTPADYLTLRTSYLSDSYLLEDFYEDEYKDLVQPESYASYTHTGDGWSWGVGVYHRVNEFYESVNRLPDAWIDVIRTQIGESPFYYESQTSGGMLQREFADYGIPSNTVAEAYDTVRIDTRHALYVPANLFGFLSVVPRAVYRGTYYADTYKEEKVETTDGTNSVTLLQMADNGAGLRNIYELGMETSFKLYGLFDTASGIVRHVIEPYINYTYIPEPNFVRSELMQFDSVDRLGQEHDARIGVRQLLQSKEVTEGGNGERREEVVTHIDADIYAKYEFDNDEGDPGLKTFGVDARFRPTDSIRIELEGEYDVDEAEIDFINLWLTLWNGDTWEAAGSCFYRPDETTLLTGAVTCNFTEEWALNLYGRYDAELSRVEEVAAYIQYNLDCISFRFRTAYQPAFTRDDGTEREAKYKFGFYMWLRAYAPERYERRLRDGSF